jgi:hypothetical protein
MRWGLEGNILIACRPQPAAALIFVLSYFAVGPL